MDVCTDQSVQTVFVWIGGYTYVCKYNSCSNGLIYVTMYVCTTVCLDGWIYGGMYACPWLHSWSVDVNWMCCFFCETSLK